MQNRVVSTDVMICIIIDPGIYLMISLGYTLSGLYVVGNALRKVSQGEIVDSSHFAIDQTNINMLCIIQKYKRLEISLGFGGHL